MTSPLPAADTAGSPGITPDAVVLQNRALLPGTHAAGLSRFGDSIWDLYPALHDQHASNQKIHWDTYPEPFRLACKYYVFALLNVTDHPPRLAFAHADVPGVKTIWAELGYLRLMLTWLLERGIRQFADVTTTDLDIYLNTVTSDDASSTSRKTKTLRAVLRLHAYRQHMPASVGLPEPVPWGGISAAELAQHTDPRRAECRTARIHPDIMQTLLSAALLTIETIAPDLLPAIQRLVTLRATALRLPPPSPGSSRWYSAADRLTTFLGALERDSHPLPGISSGDSTIIDLTGLAFAGQIDGEMLRKPHCAEILAAARLPIEKNMLRVTAFSTAGKAAWRTEPADVIELIALTRCLRAACFLVIGYLSGIRAGEVLNLRRGCVTRDDKLGLIFLSGIQMKAKAGLRERSPDTIPWVINEQGATAITVLAAMTPSNVLFPIGKFGLPEWLTSTRSRTTASLNDDISRFITWFNIEIAPVTGHLPIGHDPAGTITAQRLRRTLAWHIVRPARPSTATYTPRSLTGTPATQALVSPRKSASRNSCSAPSSSTTTTTVFSPASTSPALPPTAIRSGSDKPLSSSAKPSAPTPR